MLDPGSGTGAWARTLTTWHPGLAVIAVEPAAPMRARSVHRPVLAGGAERVPLPDGDLVLAAP
ncbi:hypothetical protein ACFY2R_15620 [Micromonospora olivasterospora]|uniref:Methyltransferase family protein n=1 Tax=Micromonospora olivasterospora TaxID=1880 RepID=A0A562IGS1_MICOL|nr:class I SAM-dependent methyltransferase [Micromonospora olivasterospora]TWH70207.1 hypothetical protein JD77_05228 [Micromonospora olivasterospora]